MTNQGHTPDRADWKLKMATMAVFVWLTCLMLVMASISIREYADYNSFLVSDWMIDYSGGFVRRGLAGQVLWYVYNHVAAFSPIRMVIVIGEVLSVAMLVLTVRLFRREGLSLLLLPAGCMFGYTLFGINGRRDFLILMLAYLLFAVYRRYRDNCRWQWLVLFEVISVILVLLHEASFFFTIPALLLIDMKRERKTMLHSVLLFAPALLAFAATAIWKGNEQIAQAIIASWSDAIAQFPDAKGELLFNGIKALTWSFQDAAIQHLTSAWVDTDNPQLYTVLFVLFNFVATFYLVTRLNTVFLGSHRPQPIDRQSLANFLVVQFVFLTPLFTVFSCDWGRTLPYWVFSSLMLWHFFRDTPLLGATRLTRLTAPVQAFMDRHTFFSNPWLYLFVLVVTPYTACLAPSLTNCSWGLPLKHLLQWLA